MSGQVKRLLSTQHQQLMLMGHAIAIQHVIYIRVTEEINKQAIYVLHQVQVVPMRLSLSFSVSVEQPTSPFLFCIKRANLAIISLGCTRSWPSSQLWASQLSKWNILFLLWNPFSFPLSTSVLALGLHLYADTDGPADRVSMAKKKREARLACLESQKG